MLISAGDIIRRSVDLYRENTKLFLHYVALYLIPTLMVSVSAAVFLGSVEPDNFNLGAAFAVYVVLVILASLISIWFSIAFIRVIAAKYEHADAGTMKGQLDHAKHRIWPAILASIVVSLIVFGGILLLIIPGIIFSLWFAFVFYSVALDDHKPIESLHISKGLVKGRWWRVLWLLFVPGLVFGIAIAIAQWIVALPFGFMDESIMTITIASILTSLVALLFTPLTTAAPTILYMELKKTPAAGPPMPPSPPVMDQPQA